MSEVQETNPIEDLIQYSIDKNYTQATKSFNDVMTIKLNDLLDQEKIRMADQVYNGVEDDPDEEQLELDLDREDEEVSDEPSDDQDTEESGHEVDDETEDELEETEDEDEE
jgi:hypothetical protein